MSIILINVCHAKTLRDVFKEENIKCQLISNPKKKNDIIYDVNGKTLLYTANREEEMIGIVYDKSKNEQKLLYRAKKYYTLEDEEYAYNVQFYDLNGVKFDLQLDNYLYGDIFMFDDKLFYRDSNYKLVCVDISRKIKIMEFVENYYNNYYFNNYVFYSKYFGFSENSNLIVFYDSNLKKIKEIEGYGIAEIISVDDKEYLLLRRRMGLYNTNAENENELGRGNEVIAYMILDENLNYVFDRAILNYKKPKFGRAFYEKEELLDLFKKAISRKFRLEYKFMTIPKEIVDKVIYINHCTDDDIYFLLSGDDKDILVDKNGKMIFELEKGCQFPKVSNIMENSIFSVKRNDKIVLFRFVDGEIDVIKMIDADTKYEVKSIDNYWFYIVEYKDSTDIAELDKIIIYNVDKKIKPITLDSSFERLGVIRHKYNENESDNNFRIFECNNKRLIYVEKRNFDGIFVRNVYGEDGKIVFKDVELCQIDKNRKLIYISSWHDKTHIYDYDLNLIKEIKKSYTLWANFNKSVDDIIIFKDSLGTFSYCDFYDEKFNLKYENLNSSLYLLNITESDFDSDKPGKDKKNYIAFTKRTKNLKYKNGDTESESYVIDTDFNELLHFNKTITGVRVLEKEVKTTNVLCFDDEYKIYDENLNLLETRKNIIRVIEKYSDEYSALKDAKDMNAKLRESNCSSYIEDKRSDDLSSFGGDYSKYYLVVRNVNSYKDKKYTVVDADNSKAVAYDYKYIERISDKPYFKFENGFKYGYMDFDGNVLIEFSIFGGVNDIKK